MPEIFISYSRKDKEYVEQIVAEIEQTAGVKCWIDLEGIDSAEQFENVIVDAISQSKVVLFMMSENSMKSKFVKKEISFAHNKGIRLVPVVIDNAEWTDWFVYQFGDLNCIHYAEPDQREILLRNLVNWCMAGTEQTRKEQEERAKMVKDSHSRKRRWMLPTAIIVGILLLAGIAAALLLHRPGLAGFHNDSSVIISKVPAEWVDSMEMRMSNILTDHYLVVDSLRVFHEMDSLFQARYAEEGEPAPAYNSTLSALRAQRFDEWVAKGDRCVDRQVADDCYAIALLIKEDNSIRKKINTE